MFNGLINKQVICSDVSIIQFIYPDFRIVRTEESVIYSINTKQPFIYSDSGLVFELVKKVMYHISLCLLQVIII